MANSRAYKRPTVGARPTVGPRFSKPELKQKLAKVIADIEPQHLAQATDCTKEGVRHWLDQTRCADGASVLNLILNFPGVREALLEESDSGSRMARSLDMALAYVTAQSAAGDPQARAVLNRIAGFR